MKNHSHEALKNTCEMWSFTVASFLLLEYLMRDFSEVTVQVHLPREFILELLNRCKA